jgi:hypothetical protein
MDLNPEPYQTCSCGRTFSQPGPFIYHQRSCSKSKKRLVGALALAKEAWVNHKRKRAETLDHERSDDHPQVGLGTGAESGGDVNLVDTGVRV